MYTQVEKPKENKSRVVDNYVAQTKSSVKQGFGFLDKRPQVAALWKLQDMANNSSQDKQAAQLLAMADNYSMQPKPLIKEETYGKTVQRKIFKNKIGYSFQNTYDLNGNPFLYSQNKERYKLKKIQPSIEITKVDDYDEEITSDNRFKFFNNFGRGRPMNAKTESGKKGTYLPFKSYTFNKDSEFEIGLTESGSDSGRLYPDINTSLNEKLDEVTSFEDYKEEFTKNKEDMELLTFGEDYRVPGALKVYNLLYKNALKEIDKQKVEFSKLDEKDKNKWSGYITKDLPYAGTGGKKRFANLLTKKRKRGTKLKNETESQFEVFKFLQNDEERLKSLKGPKKKRKKFEGRTTDFYSDEED